MPQASKILSTGIARDQPIVPLFLPIMLSCSALPIMLNIMLKNKSCGMTIVLFIYKLV